MKSIPQFCRNQIQTQDAKNHLLTAILTQEVETHYTAENISPDQTIETKNVETEIFNSYFSTDGSLYLHSGFKIPQESWTCRKWVVSLLAKLSNLAFFLGIPHSNHPINCQTSSTVSVQSISFDYCNFTVHPNAPFIYHYIKEKKHDSNRGIDKKVKGEKESSHTETSFDHEELHRCPDQCWNSTDLQIPI